MNSTPKPSERVPTNLRSKKEALFLKIYAAARPWNQNLFINGNCNIFYNTTQKTLISLQHLSCLCYLECFHFFKKGSYLLLGLDSEQPETQMRVGESSPADSPSLYSISIAVTPGYKFPSSSRIGTMKQWGPSENNGTVTLFWSQKKGLNSDAFSEKAQNDFDPGTCSVL